MDTQFLTPAEAAQYLRTSTASLANHRYRGTGPPYLKLGRRVLYDIRDIQLWVNDHKVEMIQHPRNMTL